MENLELLLKELQDSNKEVEPIVKKIIENAKKELNLEDLTVKDLTRILQEKRLNKDYNFAVRISKGVF